MVTLIFLRHPAFSPNKIMQSYLFSGTTGSSYSYDDFEMTLRSLQGKFDYLKVTALYRVMIEVFQLLLHTPMMMFRWH